MKVWYKCKKELEKISVTNAFVEKLKKSFDDRGKVLMENAVLATAVYLDPRMHHRRSSDKLLGKLKDDAEVFTKKFDYHSVLN